MNFYMQWLSSTDIQELAMGYLLPGRPLAMETFRAYNSMSMSQALSLLGDFKLGHYMKIPPRLIFIVQVMINFYYKMAIWRD